MASIELPADLEHLVLSRFDDLVAQGEAIYEPSTTETMADDGFKYQFRMVPHLLKKPITPANARERKTGEGRNPFVDPDPNFVISDVGPLHLLLLNKYCVYRPSLLLITREFVPQTDRLNGNDLSAAWATLSHLGHKYMLIYNCGYESGSSQGHKHMQLWQYPDEERMGFELFPSKARSTTDVTSDIPNVPFRHFVLRLPAKVDESTLVQAYNKLFDKVQQCHAENGEGVAYNVILVKEWMCLIPRRRCGLDKGAGANSAAMLGLVWIVKETEKSLWSADFYRYLGIPR